MLPLWRGNIGDFLNCGFEGFERSGVQGEKKLMPGTSISSV